MDTLFAVNHSIAWFLGRANQHAFSIGYTVYINLGEMKVPMHYLVDISCKTVMYCVLFACIQYQYLPCT